MPLLLPACQAACPSHRAKAWAGSADVRAGPAGLQQRRVGNQLVTFLKWSCHTKRSSPLCTINWGIPWKVPCFPGEEPGMASPPCASGHHHCLRGALPLQGGDGVSLPGELVGGGESGSGLCRAPLGPSLPSPASLEQSSSGPRVSPRTPPPLPTLPHAARHTLPEGGLRSHFP